MEIKLIKRLEFDSSVEIENFLKNEIAEDSKNSISEKKPIKKNRKETKKETKSVTKSSKELDEDLLRSEWPEIVQIISKKRGSIGAQLSGCVLGSLNKMNLELISYDKTEFNQKLLNDGIPFIKSIIDEKYESDVNINLVIDTKVEKIEDKKEGKVNENDIVTLFDGKEML